MADMTHAEFLAECIESLSARYTLVNVDYRDSLTSEQVAAIVARDYETLDESMWEWESDARHEGTDYYAKDIVSDVAKAMARAGRLDDSDEYAQEFEYADEYEALREAISERDDSDVISQLASNTSRVLMRQIIVNEDDCFSYEAVSPAAVLARFLECADDGTSFDADDDAHNLRVIEETLNECSPEYSVLFGMIVYAVDVSDVHKLSGEYVDIVNPYVYLGNPFSGTGYVGDDALRGIVRIRREDMTTDASAFGYGWNDVTGGVYVSAYECDIRDVPNEDDSDSGNGHAA